MIFARSRQDQLELAGPRLWIGKDRKDFAHARPHGRATADGIAAV